MTVDQLALARMTLYALLFGVGLELFYESLRVIWGLISPLTLHSDGHDGVPLRVAIAIRDLLFFVCAGVGFSVFVYMTNNGKLRSVAVASTIVGFFACYLTLGRLVRRITDILISAVYRLIYFILLPLRMVGRALSAAFSATLWRVRRAIVCRQLRRELERAKLKYKNKEVPINGVKKNRQKA